MEGRTGHLEVKLNGEDLGSLPLVSVEPTDYELEIPGELLSQDNSISFEVEDDDVVTQVDAEVKDNRMIGHDTKC